MLKPPFLIKKKEPSFSLAGGNDLFKRLPIKAVIEGALPPPDDGGQPIKFKRTLNYYDFRQDISFRPDTFIVFSFEIN